mmetsp:Transcript_110813/g.324206  ORF Transcript_110813/g.324206 Transcript_110813/m.324206 type:complete len:308 (+) Transcript_110813:2-925(+)
MVGLWREHWPFLEAALLRWPPSAAGDQPLAGAVDALTSAPAALPVLLPQVLHLLAQSAACHRLPDIQLRALRQVLYAIPSPPLPAAGAAELLAASITEAVGALVGDEGRVGDVARSPPTLKALYKLLASSLFHGKGGLLEGRLRPLVLARWAILRRCMALLVQVLPGCTSDGATEQMLRFAVQLVTGEELSQLEHRGEVASLLPGLCSSLCRALVLQEHLASAEGGAVDVAELLYRAVESFPSEMPAALSTGLQHVSEISEGSRLLLHQHVEGFREWPRKWEWVVQLQNIIGEWQSERCQARHLLSA